MEYSDFHLSVHTEHVLNILKTGLAKDASICESGILSIWDGNI
jgi:hypothetical protein